MAARFGDYDSSSDGDRSGDESAVDYQEVGALVVSPSKVVGALEHLKLDGILEDSSDFERLNEYAIDHLLSFLSVNDLKNYRLVSTTWNRACLKAIPQQGHVVRVPRNVEDINRLNALIKSSDHFPWTKFELNAAGTTTDEEATAINHLFGIVAPFVNELGINGLTSKLISIGGLEFPALKVVKFYCHQDSPVNGVGFVKDIVNGANLLVTLELEGNGMISSFVELLETVNGQKISRLVLKSMVKNGDLIRLSQLSLQLQFLCLHFVQKDGEELSPEDIISSESLWTFLQSQREYLKTLNLAVVLMDPWYDNLELLIPEVHFPRMTKLTQLSIEFASNFRDVDYATTFPVLKTLKFEKFTGNPNTSLAFFHDGHNPVETLEELQFGLHVDIVDSYDIRCASRKFPNLRKMQFQNEVSLLVSLSTMIMPKLEELWLVCSNMMDDAIDYELCGIPGPFYEDLSQLPESELKILAENWEPPKCLKGIRKLGLVAEGGRRGRFIRLTPIAYYFGLFKMKRLETLELVGNCSEISAGDIDELRRKFTVIIRE